MNSLTNFTPGQLRLAANLKEKIDNLQRQLSRLLGGSAPASGGPARGKRKISAAGRAHIAAAARARWAKFRSKFGGKAAARKPRRKMSAAARARLSAIARARWKK